MSATRLKTTATRLNITADQSAKLVKLAREIRSLYKNADTLVRTAQQKGREAIAEAILCGQKLNEAKGIVKHGGWLKWLKQTCKGISDDTASRYMQLANSAHVRNLNSFTSLRQAYIAAGIIEDSEPTTTEASKPHSPVFDVGPNPTPENFTTSVTVPGTLRSGYLAPVTIGKVARDTGAERIKRIRTMTVALETELKHLPKPHVAEAERERKALWGDDKSGFQPIDVKKAHAMAEAIAALNKVKEAGRTAGLSTEDTVLELTKQDLELKREIAEAEDNSVEKVKLQTHEQEIQNKLAEEKKKLADENNRKLEEEKRLNEQIADARERLRFSIQERQDSVYDAFKPTVEQVAQTGQWVRHGNNTRWRWQASPFARDAQNVEDLEAQARNAYAWGNEALGNQLTDRRNSLRGYLESHGIVSHDRHIERMDENIAKQQGHLETLAGTVAGGKLKIKPEMGE